MRRAVGILNSAPDKSGALTGARRGSARRLLAVDQAPVVERQPIGASDVELRRIYAAAGDDQAFSTLAGYLARAIGACSAVVGWQSSVHANLGEGSLHTIKSSKLRAAGNGVVMPHMVSCSSERDGFQVRLEFYRREQRPRFDRDALARIQRWSAPVVDVMILRAKLALATAEVRARGTTLDMVGVALMRIDSEARVEYANRLASAVLRREDGLVIHAGRLHAIEAESSRRLNDFLAAGDNGPGHYASAINIVRADGSRYTMSITGCVSASGRSFVLAWRDPAHLDHAMPERLRELYGLGAAEAEVTCLMAKGIDLTAIAQLRKTSIDTVRSQVKSIFSKMGCNRQSEIIIAVHQIPIIELGGCCIAE